MEVRLEVCKDGARGANREEVLGSAVWLAGLATLIGNGSRDRSNHKQGDRRSKELKAKVQWMERPHGRRRENKGTRTKARRQRQQRLGSRTSQSESTITMGCEFQRG
jgi:hypothetical protein